MHLDLQLPWYLDIRRLFKRPQMSIDVTSVAIRHVVKSEEGERDWLIAVLDVNQMGANEDDPELLDLEQLQSSLNADGDFFIWTCSCGVPGCAGMFDGVRVTHGNGKTAWDDLDCKRQFFFDSHDLRRAFDDAILAGRQLLLDRPDLDVTPDQNAPYYTNDG